MRIILSRILIATVVLFNLQCAMLFVTNPQPFLAAFELIGNPGMATLRGIGVLFLMWNVPYLVALYHPVHHRVSLVEAIVMQSIGVIGESLIYQSLPLLHGALRASIARFILFDAMGLLMLVVALLISRKS